MGAARNRMNWRWLAVNHSKSTCPLLERRSSWLVTGCLVAMRHSTRTFPAAGRNAQPAPGLWLTASSCTALRLCACWPPPAPGWWCARQRLAGQGPVAPPPSTGAARKQLAAPSSGRCGAVWRRCARPPRPTTPACWLARPTTTAPGSAMRRSSTPSRVLWKWWTRRRQR
jgi:hypothetical protein